MTQSQILGFVAVREEARYVSRTIPHLAANGIGVVVLDNGSPPPVRAVLDELREVGLIERIVDVPWTGTFDLAAQLAVKARLVAETSADWVLHMDADEMPHSWRPNESLAQAIARADAWGCNVVNFEEFVFLPIDPVPDSSPMGYFPFEHYYLFAPRALRLMRAWRRDAELCNQSHGGHSLLGDNLRVFPENMVLRHYPFLSQEHAFTKYTQRRFHAEDLARGWHGNRIDFERARFTMPSTNLLRQLREIDQRDLDRSDPKALHFWQWPEPACA